MDLFVRAAAPNGTTANSTTRATPQGGILEGANPSHYDPKNPIILFIIQAGIIIVFCRLLHFPLSKLRQPRVIAEVLAGILLGPSVMGRIPHFKQSIFPDASMPVLSNVANLGLILFLFLVGLEVNMRLFLVNWRAALCVGAAGMALPFGLGCAIAYGLYHQFSGEPGTRHISFPVYMLFIGVAMAITAFPVLCRILTELKLLGTNVGVVVLSAGVANDVTGWILLALCVALVNAGTGITALWVLLSCVGWILFLVYAVRPVFMWILRRTGSIQNGPTQSVVAITLLLALTSAFFTGIIGVHPIFGGFMVGLICPHDGGFAIKLTEKVEDLVTVLFLPLYFALSGLSTNLGLLNDGTTWAYVIGVIAVAFFGKLIGGTLAARFCKLVWRESFTIGVLMSCKGLVELIVLNIGLQAKILSTRTFTIFVVMALVTTCATTPLTSALYPPWYQIKLERWRAGEIDWEGNLLKPSDDSSDQESSAPEKPRSTEVQKLLVYLRLDNLSSLFTFITLLGGSGEVRNTPKVHPAKSSRASKGAERTVRAASELQNKRFEVNGVRLVELTERTSTVMQVSEVDEWAIRDPVVNVFHTFGQMHNVAVSGQVCVVPEGSYAETLVARATDYSSDLVLIPWSETGNISEANQSVYRETAGQQFTSGPHNQFIKDALRNTKCDTAVFINRGFGGPLGEHADSRGLSRTFSGISVISQRKRHPISNPIRERSHHIFLPFFGGADDRAALRFTLQLVKNEHVTATIVYINADNLHEEKGSNSQSKNDRTFFNTLADSLPREVETRVFFDSVDTTQALHDVILRAREEVESAPDNAGNLIIVGRGEHMHNESLSSSFEATSSGGLGPEVRRSLGILAEAFIVGERKTSVLVFQAKGRNFDD